MTGAELLEALEASTYCTPESIGGFPQAAGVTFMVKTYEEYDANPDPYPKSTYYGPKSIQRVTIDNVNGKTFDPTATYAVVTNNFVAGGGVHVLRLSRRRPTSSTPACRWTRWSWNTSRRSSRASSARNMPCRATAS